MRLPAAVLNCLTALENAGYSTYAVGGCVRDAVLGLRPKDYDLCTAALPQQTKAIFSGFQLVLAGEKHGTIGVLTPDGVIEITTFRTEGGYHDNRHPDWVKFVPTIEEDLARRDFTVNAMAFSPTRGFVDPFGGREDLKNHVLRCVGNPVLRFQEDSLRILRGVRFAVRYQLTPEPVTEEAMNSLAPWMDNLARERVFEELCKLLLLISADDLLRFRRIFAAVIPELAPTFDFDQRTPHHAYDLFTHTAHVTASVPATLPLRWAGLLHDVGKVPACTIDENGRGHFKGHANFSAHMADNVLLRLKAPAALRERVSMLVSQHMTPLEPDRKLLRRRLSQYGEEAVEQLLALQEADFYSKGKGETTTRFDQIHSLLSEMQEENACLSLRDLAVNGKDLIKIGYHPGKALGDALNQLLSLVIDEAIPNTKSALLQEAVEMREKS